MAEIWSAQSGFAGYLRPVGNGPAGVVLTPRDGLDLANVMARPGKGAALAARAAQLWNIALPASPRRIAAGTLAFAGIAPGQWLATLEGGSGLAGRLAAALGDTASVSDQSDGRAVLRIAGCDARATLQKSLPVDLHPAVFDTGSVAATVMGLVGVVVWRAGDDAFEIAAPRSMAGDVAHMVLLDAAEFGVAIAARNMQPGRKSDDGGKPFGPPA